MTAPSIWNRGAPYVEPQPDPRTLLTMAQQIMALLLQCFATQGVSPPARQIIYTSAVAADCSQIVVLMSGWQAFPESEGPQRCEGFRWMGQFAVGISRECTPQPKGNRPPTPEAMLAMAATASADAEVLLCLVSSITEAMDATVTIGAPQGGIQTTELSILVPAAGGLD